MKLELKKPEMAKFYIFVKMFMYEYGNNGIVMEKEGNAITLYASNGAHNVMFCKIPMGSKNELRGLTYVITAPDEDHILVDAGRIKVVINYREQVATTSKPDCMITGSKAWGENVQIDWNHDYNKFFNYNEFFNAPESEKSW